MFNDATLNRLERELSQLISEERAVSTEIRSAETEYQSKLRELSNDRDRKVKDLEYRLDRLTREHGDKEREVERQRQKLQEDFDKKH
jgi:chromosome segregation ATPase